MVAAITGTGNDPAGTERHVDLAVCLSEPLSGRRDFDVVSFDCGLWLGPKQLYFSLPTGLGAIMFFYEPPGRPRLRVKSSPRDCVPPRSPPSFPGGRHRIGLWPNCGSSEPNSHASLNTPGARSFFRDRADVAAGRARRMDEQLVTSTPMFQKCRTVCPEDRSPTEGLRARGYDSFVRPACLDRRTLSIDRDSSVSVLV